MNARTRFRSLARQARLGNLGTLAMSLPRSEYDWYLHNVYDLRYPHVGDDRHLRVRTFDSLQSGAKVRLRYRKAGR